MAEQQQANALAAAFPSPPPFYQHFTTENIARVAELRAAQSSNSTSTSDTQATPNIASGSKTPLRLLDLPPELRFLQPPEPPVEGAYRSFGDIFNLNDALPSLAEQNIEQLYTPPSTPSPDGSSSHFDRALILKRLAKSLLLNFLELMGIMSINPEQYMDKIQDLRTLFINFHHLLNEYRPHQARESLILMMEEQLRRSKDETEGIERMKTKVEGILEGLGQAKSSCELEDVTEQKAVKSNVAEDAIWEELAIQFG